jgi:hypothetical protein
LRSTRTPSWPSPSAEFTACDDDVPEHGGQDGGYRPDSQTNRLASPARRGGCPERAQMLAERQPLRIVALSSILRRSPRAPGEWGEERDEEKRTAAAR